MLVIFNTLEKTSGAWPQIACNDSRGNPFCPREVGLNPLQWDKKKKPVAPTCSVTYLGYLHWHHRLLKESNEVVFCNEYGPVGMYTGYTDSRIKNSGALMY